MEEDKSKGLLLLGGYMKEVHHITEMWIDEYHTLCQTILYEPNSPMAKPSINPNLTILVSKIYWDKDNKVIKEEKYED